MRQPPPEPVCKPSQMLPACTDSDSEAHNLSSVTHTESCSRVTELPILGKSLTVTERLSLKAVSRKTLCTQLKLPLRAEHILLLLKVFQGQLLLWGFCRARKSLLWCMLCILDSVCCRGTQILLKCLDRRGYQLSIFVHGKETLRAAPVCGLGNWACKGWSTDLCLVLGANHGWRSPQYAICDSILFTCNCWMLHFC